MISASSLALSLAEFFEVFDVAEDDFEEGTEDLSPEEELLELEDEELLEAEELEELALEELEALSPSSSLTPELALELESESTAALATSFGMLNPIAAGTMATEHSMKVMNIAAIASAIANPSAPRRCCPLLLFSSFCFNIFATSSLISASASLFS